MIYVNTFVSESATNNLGLFAGQDIQKGQLIWKYNASTCLIVTPEQEHVLLESKVDALTKSIHHFGCPNNRGCLIHMDNMRYINHSNYPNTMIVDEDTMIATRDIKCGEELHEDYHSYSSYRYCVEFLTENKE